MTESRPKPGQPYESSEQMVEDLRRKTEAAIIQNPEDQVFPGLLDQIVEIQEQLGGGAAPDGTQ